MKKDKNDETAPVNVSPVSLSPLSFEEALGGLQKVPPQPRKSKTAKKKSTKKKPSK